MATSDYEAVLHEARLLPPQEMRHLRNELDRVSIEGEMQGASDTGHAAVISLAQARAMYAVEHSTPLSEEERAATLAALDQIDQLAAEIGATWTVGMSASEAVREQRREL